MKLEFLSAAEIAKGVGTVGRLYADKDKPSQVYAGTGSGFAPLPYIDPTTGGLVGPDGPVKLTRILRNLPAPVVGLAQTAEQILDQVAIPAGTLGVNGDVLEVVLGLEKTADSETLTARLRLGAAGTTADAQLDSSSVLSTTLRSFGSVMYFRRVSATSVVRLGSAATSGFPMSAASAGVNSAVTVANLDTTALIFSASVALSVGAATPTLQSFIVRKVPA